MVDHIWINIDIKCLEEICQANTVNGFTDTFMLKSVIGKEINNIFG